LRAIYSRKHLATFLRPSALVTVGHHLRVARWFVLKPKIQIWVYFGGSCNGRCW
jgi:hypothetical protein